MTQDRSYREAVARLSSAQKSNRGAAGYSRWINRRLGRHLAAWAYVRDLTPNQVSAISALFTFPSLAAVGIWSPSWYGDILITLGLLAGYAFDSADGQLARLRGGGSPAGEWLDHVLDALKMASVHLLVAVAWFRFYDLEHASYLLVPLAAAVVATVFFFALLLTDMLRRVSRTAAGGSSATTASLNPDEAAPVLRSLVVLPNDYGVLCLTFLLLPWHTVFGVVYAILLVANTLFLLTGCLRWFRELNQI
jgi:phosphatidylglycerophosphate synthase